MYRKQIILSFLLLISLPAFLFADQIKLGGREGWNDVILDGTKIIPAEINRIILMDSEYEPDSDTEMLLHFNTGFYDAGGVYRVKQNNGVRISSNITKKGGGAAAFNGDGNFLELIPSESAVFAAGSGRLNDFSIEFWLNPARLSEGEHIIQWTGALKTEEETLQQEILCGITGRDIFWDFSNFFLGPQMEKTSFRLSSSRSLIPRSWHHHIIRYDNTTGLLEYLIDGIPEDIVYTNSTGEETSEIYSPTAGASKPSRFVIGRDFTGYIDELRISSGQRIPNLDKYSQYSGTAASGILDLGFYDSRFINFDSDYVLKGKTQIYFYYRISNSYFQPRASAPGWIQFEPGTILEPEVKGRYLQLMAELYPDGTGINSPELKTIDINFEKNLPPLPPAYFTGTEGSGKVILKWKAVTDPDIAGYRIYYGTKPGLYFSTEAAEGASPLDAGNQTSMELTGLDNGKLYYFAVTSYDNAEIPHESPFSREISLRPSAVIRE